MIRVNVPLAFLLVETDLLEEGRDSREEEEEEEEPFLRLLENMDVMRICPLERRLAFFDFFPAADFSEGCEDGITAGSEGSNGRKGEQVFNTS